MLTALIDHLPTWLLVALLGLALGLLALVLWAARRGADGDHEDDADPDAPAAAHRPGADTLRQSFRQALRRLESRGVSRRDRDRISWTLVLNTVPSGQPLALQACGIPSALTGEEVLSDPVHGLQWHCFDRGMVLQVQDGVIGASDRPSAVGGSAWDPLLDLCRRHRSQRPLDAVVVAVPAAALLMTDSASGPALSAHAQHVLRRLRRVHQRLAMQFPVYLVIAECEEVPGFTAFARAVPDGLRRSMLGWSSPYALGAAFQPAWMDDAMDAVVRDIQDTCAELSASALPGDDSADYFLLPMQVESLRRGLRLFVEELLRPGGDPAPFLFRGVYFTGDSSEAAALRAQTPRGRPAPHPDDPGHAADPIEPSLEDAPAPLPSVATLDGPPPRLPSEPAFLRDLFELKVFAEIGLVSASPTQHLTRPLASRALRWTAVAVPALWALGLAIYTVRLSQLTPQIVHVLQELDHHGRARGEPVDLARDRARVLGTLGLMEHIEGGRIGAVLMPGSWSAFDDLHVRLRERLERGFIENAIEPLRLGAYARVSELTGVPTDPATGTLIAGDTCTLPAGWTAHVQASQRASLNVEDLAEFSALLAYAANLEDLDQGVQALERLTQPRGGGSGEDLRVALRVFLGAEVGARLDSAAALLRRPSVRLAPLSMGPMQQAAACAFETGTRALYARVFERNDLLLSQQGIDAVVRSLAGAGSGIDRALMQRGWQSVLDTLVRQEVLMAAGKGAWMRHPELSLGPAHDALMQRLQRLALVGPSAVLSAERQAQDGFGRFRAQWTPWLQADAPQALGVGFLWQEKEARWSHSPERIALREALANLLGQPFMQSVPRTLPEPAAGQAVAWDPARLDQALSLVQVRAKLEAEVLPKVPPAVREDLHAMMRGALADAMGDLLAQSVMFMPAAVAPAVSEADRLRLARVGSALADLQARSASARLAQVLARDATVRLKRLDDALAQGDFYRPRDPDFRSWSGEKSPMTAAFGAGDAAGLAVYAATQQAFVDALAREAQALLPALEGSGGLMVQRWRGITNDLARYRLKSAASSLSQLEQFVLTTTADVDLLNCADKVRPMPRRVGDFFSDQLAALQSALAARCQDLRRTETREAWTHFAEAFNRELAARAPFRAFGAGGADRPPADVEEGGAVLQAFERAQRLLGARVQAGEPVRRFAEQMERVRAFMAPLYPTQPDAAAGYDLYVEFRANTANEHQGNKIIDWSLTVGPQTLRAREPVRALRWEPGLPIEVRLRLARDAPVAPQAEAGQPVLSIEDSREARYRFSDPWALYSLLASQREPESSSRTDARSQLLRFEFPLRATGTSAMAEPQDLRARVFLRLTVSPAGKRAPLAWPGAFPVRAPQWSTP